MSSLPSGAGRPSSRYLDDPAAGPLSDSPRDPDFDPYASYGNVHPPPASASALISQRTREGYVPARTSSPPPPMGPSHSHATSTSSVGVGHVQRDSVASLEPLIAAAGIATPPLPTPPVPVAATNSSGPPIPPRSPRRPPAVPAVVATEDAGADIKGMPSVSASSVYSDDDQLVDLLPRPLEVCCFLRIPMCHLIYVIYSRYATCPTASALAVIFHANPHEGNNTLFMTISSLTVPQ